MLMPTADRSERDDADGDAGCCLRPTAQTEDGGWQDANASAYSATNEKGSNDDGGAVAGA